MPLVLLDRCRDRLDAQGEEEASRDDSSRDPWYGEGGRLQGGGGGEYDYDAPPEEEGEEEDPPNRRLWRDAPSPPRSWPPGRRNRFIVIQ